MKSISLSSLNGPHKAQVSSYQSFMTKRTRSHVSEIAGAFDDAKDMKLLEDMYSKKDALKMLDAISDSVQAGVGEQYKLYAHRSGLYMNQLFMQAEARQCHLKLDLQELDQEVLLDGLSKLFLADKNLTAGGKLTSLGHGGVDVNLVEQSKDAQSHLESATTEFSREQRAAKDEMKRNMDLKTQVRLLREQLDATRGDVVNLRSGDSSAQQQQISELRRRIEIEASGGDVARLQAELEQTKQELSGSIASSTQFKTLKSMIQAKNKQVKELRAQLA